MGRGERKAGSLTNQVSNGTSPINFSKTESAAPQARPVGLPTKLGAETS